MLPFSYGSISIMSPLLIRFHFVLIVGSNDWRLAMKVRRASVFFYDRVEFNEFALMLFPVVDEFSRFFTHGVNIVESRQAHIAIKVGGRWSGVY